MMPDQYMEAFESQTCAEQSVKDHRRLQRFRVIANTAVFTLNQFVILTYTAQAVKLLVFLKAPILGLRYTSTHLILPLPLFLNWA